MFSYENDAGCRTFQCLQILLHIRSDGVGGGEYSSLHPSLAMLWSKSCRDLMRGVSYIECDINESGSKLIALSRTHLRLVETENRP